MEPDCSRLSGLSQYRGQIAIFTCQATWDRWTHKFYKGSLRRSWSKIGLRRLRQDKIVGCLDLIIRSQWPGRFIGHVAWNRKSQERYSWELPCLLQQLHRVDNDLQEVATRCWGSLWRLWLPRRCSKACKADWRRSRWWHGFGQSRTLQ